MWCDTVPWLNPTGSMSSQTHASLFSWEATIDNKRSRVGSARAFSVPASWSASARVRMPLVTGEQQAASTVVSVWSGEAVMAPVCHVLTLVNVRVAYALITIDLRKDTPVTTTADIREQVRLRYAAAATAVQNTRATDLTIVDGDPCCGPASAVDPAVSSCCGSSGEADERFGASLYSAGEQGELPVEAVIASLGCGNPIAVADLHPGERVLDLGSGGGIDVLLSARRVGDTGFAYGVDMTDEMLELARANQAKAGLTNVEFLKGTIENVPLPDASVDVVISNCVINLSTDKPAVIAEMFRVLAPGGRLGISDVVAEDHLTPEDRAERGSYVGCIAGALSKAEYLDGLVAAGFVDAEVRFTHQAASGMHSAIVRAVKPAA
jgi:arsenite methyltransferase